MKLIYTDSKKEVKLNDIVKDFRGDKVEVLYFEEPHKRSSSGKVRVKNLNDGSTGYYYVGVIGAEWMERG